MTTLHEQLRADLHAAMRAKDSMRRDTIRMLEAAIKNLEIAKQTPPTDEDVVGLIQKQIRQREESVEMFERGGRGGTGCQGARGDGGAGVVPAAATQP